jgi:transcriptional antiterminator RfaH
MPNLQEPKSMTATDADQVGWFCLKSQPKHEHIAAAHLRKMADVEVFSPRLRFQRATTRGARWFVESMFPGYLFARFNFQERFREVRSAMGVTMILQFGNEYAKLSPSIIEGLRQQTNAEHIAVIESTFKEGDTVKIVEGALRGLEAVVMQFLSGHERVRLLLDFLGRDIQAEVRVPAVLPIRRHPLAE